MGGKPAGEFVTPLLRPGKRLLEDQEELIPAHSGGPALPAVHRVADVIAEDPDDLVPSPVAVLVVDLFKSVDVHNCGGDRTLLLLGPADHKRKLGFNVLLVVQSGKIVLDCDFVEFKNQAGDIGVS